MDIGIKRIGATPYAPFGGQAADRIKPDYKYLHAIDERVRESAREKGFEYLGGIEGHPCQSYKTESVKEVKNYRNRDAASFNMHVACNGDVYPCVFMERDPFRVGNLCTETAESIVNKLELMNEKIKTRLPPKCVQCGILGECGGGCPGLIWDRHQTLNTTDPRCRR